MKRFKKPKGKGSGGLTRKQKDDIIVYVMKKLFPRYAGLLLTAVRNETDISVETLNRIIDTAARYASLADEGILSPEDVTREVEKVIGRRLEDVLCSSMMFDDAP